MSTLIVLPNDILGGAEQYLKMVANYHTSVPVHIVFLHKTDSKQWNDTPKNITKTYITSRFQIIKFVSIFFYFLFKKNKKIEYIFTSHVFMTSLVGIFINLGLIKKQHFIARESTSIFTRFSGLKLLAYRIAYYLGYNKVDLLICQTEFMKNQLLEGLPKKLQKLNVKVIPNPIDLALISRKEKINIELEVPLKFLVSAGRLIPEKGFDLLIESFREVSKKFSDVKLLILGEGYEREKLEKLVEKLSLKDSVLLPGLVNNVYPFFRSAEICVVSSRIEGFPNVLLQMMSQNENVISTLCAGGISDLPCITKIPTHDVSALSTAIIEQLNNLVNYKNRAIFDEVLKDRSITIFMEKADALLVK